LNENQIKIIGAALQNKKSYVFTCEKRYWEKLQICYLKVLNEVSECRVLIEMINIEYIMLETKYSN